MNEPQDLLKRLLKLYPVALLKQHFDSTQSGDALQNEIVQTNNQNLIKEFAYTHLNQTKQHIYTFSLNRRFNRERFNIPKFPLNIEKILEDQDGILTFVCLPKVQFKVVIDNPATIETIEFYQPVKITYNRQMMIIQTTIVARTEKSFFLGVARPIVSSSKIGKEEEFITSLVNKIEELTPLNHADLNRGIKHLLDNDVLDFRDAIWKKENSVNSQRMDGDLTLKQTDPIAYADIMKSPLRKSLFKSLRIQDDFPKHFVLDATSGEIGITNYPENLNQINNVIREIISHN